MANWQLPLLKGLLVALLVLVGYTMGVAHEKGRVAEQQVKLAQQDSAQVINNINKRLGEISAANKQNQQKQLTIKEIQRAIDEAISNNPTTGCNLSPDELRAFQRAADSTRSVVSGSGMANPE